MPCLQHIKALVPALFMSASLSFLPLPALALDKQNPPPETIPTLAPVTVIATVEKTATGQSIVNRKDIERLPGGNGSINELLRVLPGVQFSEEANSSLTGGEILPPNISITGGKVFQNNFLIDGIGNDSLLDPIKERPNSSTFLQGHPQAMFVDSSLVDQITLYDSNIPAEFGGFTGGVVDAETLNPGPEFSGSINYRTTSDRWTDFHIDRDEKEDFENSKDHGQQPRFEKHDAGATLNLPLNEDMGLLASYQILYSEIPLNHLGETRNQTRKLENFFLKYAATISDVDFFTATALYTPYSGEYFYKDSANSDYTTDGGGYSLSLNHLHLFPLGELEIKGAYLGSEKSRTAPPHLFLWRVSESKDWGALVDSTTSREGMLGTLDSTQETYQFKSDFAFSPLDTGPLTHRVKVGVGYERVRGTYERKEESSQYYSPSLEETVVCDEEAIDCIDGEQYFKRRIIFRAGSTTAIMNQYHFYLEDLITWERLELRPGLRVSHDDFMENTNYAPRLAASYDLLGNGRTVLIGGLNRYYGKTLLAYKLREGIKPTITETRDLDENGRPTLVSSREGWGYKYSKLETPHSDELVLGLDQAAFGGKTVLRYVRREGEDEFARQRDDEERADGIKYHTLNNNGNSRHEEYRISWEREWRRHYLSLNATYQDTTTSNEDYGAYVEDEDILEKVWYEGEVIDRGELPRTDFNRHWLANLTYSVRLPHGFTFTNFTKYRSGHEGKKSVKTSNWTAAGIPEDVDAAYLEKKWPESLIFDWKLDWRRRTFRNQELTLSLEAYNVFNEKAPVGGEDDEYELGRRFWAGMEYIF